ncbi:hemolysin D [Aureimonas sp. SA4125]|nr:hemolysin D [Aureimonas sp. SA4125]
MGAMATFKWRIGPQMVEEIMSVRNRIILPLVAVLAFAGMPAAAQEAAPANPAPAGVAPVGVAPPAPSVSVVPATVRELVARVTITGTLVPRETVMVGADVDGLRIEALLADEGDRVSAGEVLARLSTDLIETDLAQNVSQLARADAAIAQAESQIAQAEAAAIEADAALARSRPLATKGIVGQDVLEQRVSAAAGARAQLASARQGVAVAVADKAVLDANRRQLELRKAKAEIKAPTDGLVLSRSARLGAIASAAGGALFEIARDGLIELDAAVSETVLASLKRDQAVSVSLAGSSEPLVGHVRLVSPKVDETTRLGRVLIALDPSPSLRTGMFARGTVEIARSRGVTVPQTAVVVDGDKALVQVVNDGTIESRDVTTGISSGGDIEITGGIKEGERVVALAGTFVRNGDAVTAVEIDPEAKG